MDNNKTILRSAGHFLSGTMISRFSGLLRDVLMAFAFGTSGSLAALMIAFRFSHIFRRLFGEGALHAAFVPHYESIKKQNPGEALNFYVDVKRSLTLWLFFLVMLVSIPLFSYSYFFEGSSEIAFLTLLLMPGLIFICLYGLNSSLLQCERNYFTPSMAPVAFNFVWIIGVLCLMKFSGEIASPWLALFIVLASAAQWAYTLPKTNKILKTHVNKNPKKKLLSEETKRLLYPLMLSILGVSATQINSALDPVFARFTDVEGPAYLWYAIRLMQFPIGLIGVAVSNALLPPLARAIKNQEMEKYKSFLDNAFQKTLFFMIPFSFAFICAGDTSVNLLFGHGDFGIHSIKETTFCLIGYAIGIVPTTLILILAPGFQAFKEYKIPMLFSIISVVVNIIFNALFVFYFSWGAFSVALATSFSAWVNFIGLYICLRKKIGVFISSNTLFLIGKIIAVTLIGTLCLYYIDFLNYGGNYLMTYLNNHVTLPLPTNFLGQIVKFILEAVVFGFPAILFGLYEFTSLFKRVDSYNQRS